MAYSTSFKVPTSLVTPANETVSSDFTLIELNSQYSLDVETDTQLTLMKESTQAKSISCSAGDDSTGVGLWQWVVASSDGSVNVMTEHSVCRYGELWNTPPLCPFFACEDAAGCTSCKEGWAKDLQQESKITDTLNAKIAAIEAE